MFWILCTLVALAGWALGLGATLREDGTDA